MQKRSLSVVVFTPILVYLVAMLALAVFSLHPPTLGWIGLGLLSAAGLATGWLAVTLIPRMGVNVVRHHPGAEAPYRLLVVADAEIEPSELCSAARLRVMSRPSEVRVVAPVLVSALHYLSADEGGEHAAAERRLADALAALGSAGIHALGTVGVDDPMQAVGDVLVQFPADELLLVATLPASREWNERHFEQRARDLFGLPVSTLYGRPAPARRDGALAAA